MMNSGTCHGASDGADGAEVDKKPSDLSSSSVFFSRKRSSAPPRQRDGEPAPRSLTNPARPPARPAAGGRRGGLRGVARRAGVQGNSGRLRGAAAGGDRAPPGPGEPLLHRRGARPRPALDSPCAAGRVARAFASPPPPDSAPSSERACVCPQEGRTALHYAAERGDAGCLAALLEAGAATEARDRVCVSSVPHRSAACCSCRPCSCVRPSQSPAPLPRSASSARRCTLRPPKATPSACGSWPPPAPTSRRPRRRVACAPRPPPRVLAPRRRRIGKKSEHSPGNKTAKRRPSPGRGDPSHRRGERGGGRVRVGPPRPGGLRPRRRQGALGGGA